MVKGRGKDFFVEMNRSTDARARSGGLKKNDAAQALPGQKEEPNRHGSLH
jgi:hypothetical protein